ncbi:MAG: hypothetical protein GY866_11035 [Proteobacteria bacterium]|nr:hypothetical protein [Pseudomonadota bacterium]
MYWFYKSKEELLYSTLINGFQRSTRSFRNGDGPNESDTLVGADVSLVELERFLRDFYMIAVKQPPFSQVFVMNGIFNRQFYESRAYAPFKTFVDGISTRLDEGKAAGSIRAEVNNRLFRNLVLGTFCHSVVRWHVVEKESWHNIVNDIDLIVRYLLRTITIKNEKKKRKRRKKSK